MTNVITNNVFVFCENKNVLEFISTLIKENKGNDDFVLTYENEINSVSFEINNYPYDKENAFYKVYEKIVNKNKLCDMVVHIDFTSPWTDGIEELAGELFYAIESKYFQSIPFTALALYETDNNSHYAILENKNIVKEEKGCLGKYAIMPKSWYDD